MVTLKQIGIYQTTNVNYIRTITLGQVCASGLGQQTCRNEYKYIQANWGSKWLVDFNAGKAQLVSFDQSSNIDTIDEKMDGSVLDKNSSFKMVGLPFCYKLDLGS